MEKEKKSLDIAKLIVEQLQQQADAESRAKLEAWLDEAPENRELFQALQKGESLKDGLGWMSGINVDAAWARFSENTFAKVPVKPISFWQRPAFRLAATVVILVGLVTWIYWFTNAPDEGSSPQIAISPAYLNDVDPGGNKAILTLADGSIMELEDIENGVVSRQGNTEVKKLKSGELVYTTKGKPQKGFVGVNLLSTPRGGQYHVVLPDGSEVWLNAATTLKYPTAFAGLWREVELTGEAFFSIKHDATKPFRVSTSHQRTEVLGTQFNISAYRDEPAEVITLTEGKVKVDLANDQTQTTELSPGRQAIITQVIKTRTANIEQVTAWKEGQFYFDETDLPAIMRQLGRWYDVEVKFLNNEQKEKFNGRLPRNVSLNNVLKILEMSDVKFRVEGNVITVL